MNNIALWLLLIVLCFGGIASLSFAIHYISLIYKTDQERSNLSNTPLGNTKDLGISEKDFLNLIEIAKNIHASNFEPRTEQNNTKSENVLPFARPNIKSELVDNLRSYQ